MTGSSAEQSQGDAEWRTSVQQLAARVRHDLNNPLAALLAEAQLLSMEPALAEEHRMAVHRIIELTRRVITTVRELEAFGVNGATRNEDGIR